MTPELLELPCCYILDHTLASLEHSEGAALMAITIANFRKHFPPNEESLHAQNGWIPVPGRHLV